MKKVTVLCGLLLALCATVASAAQGTNIRWQNCFGDGGLFNKTSACSNNLGQSALVASFQLAAETDGVTGVEIVIDLASASPTLPAWWQFNPGQCRAGALGGSVSNSVSAVNCFDWSNNKALGGIAAYDDPSTAPNNARIKAGAAVSAANIANLPPDVELFDLNVLITNANTTGASACSGCLVPVCIVHNSTNVVQGTTGHVLLTGPTNGLDSNTCTWQGGAGVVVGGKSGCPLAVSTSKRTWSSVKALYNR